MKTLSKCKHCGELILLRAPSDDWSENPKMHWYHLVRTKFSNDPKEYIDYKRICHFVYAEPIEENENDNSNV